MAKSKATDAASSPPPKRLSKAELDEYFRLDAERLALNRQAKDIEALQEKLEARMTAVVKADGGKERAVVTCGYRLAIAMANGSVKWKDEFVRAVGLDAAEKLIQAAPKKEKLTVEPLSAASKAA